MTTTTKGRHTPGPLQVREVHGCLYVCDADGNSLANLGGADPRAKSDATLYAASPDLLEALRDALRFIAYVRENYTPNPIPPNSDSGLDWDVEGRARAVMAKMEGGQS